MRSTGAAGAVLLVVTLTAAACTGGNRDPSVEEKSASTAESRPSTSASTSPTTSVEGVKAGTVKVVAAGDIAATPRDGRGTARLITRAAPDFVLALGDTAYDSGTRAEFRGNYHPTWGEFRRITRPAPGNHEYRTKGAAGYFRYFRNQVDRPFYGWDAGAWRMYSLNCEIRCGRNSRQLAWLKRDISRHPGQPRLAYVHRPRFTCSKHPPFTGLRAIWRVLDRRNGKLVLSGHNHTYERFPKLDAAGRPSGEGMRQFVVGTGGKEFYSPGPRCRGRQAAFGKADGILVLRLRADGYSWLFRTVGGRVRDRGSATF